MGVWTRAVSAPPIATTALMVILVAVATIHRPAPAWLEWHTGLLAAIGADSWIQCVLASVGRCEIAGTARDLVSSPAEGTAVRCLESIFGES